MTDHWGPIQGPIHRKKKRKRRAVAVLFKIVPQAAITPPLPMTDHWYKILEKENKERMEEKTRERRLAVDRNKRCSTLTALHRLRP